MEVDGQYKENTNLAPVKPLQQLATDRVVRNSTYLSDGIKELVREKLNDNKEVWKEIANTTEITSNFIQGKQLWTPNYWTGSWRIAPVNRADPNKISAINIMQFYCTTQVRMMVASNPDLEPAEEFRNKHYRDRIKVNKAIWNRFESKFYTAFFNQQEAIHAIISGNYLESVRYDNLKQSCQVFRETFETKQIEISSGGSTCFSCGYKGPYNEFAAEDDIPRCPDCKSAEILPPEEPVTQLFQTVSGVEAVTVGDLAIRLIPIQTTRFDIKKRAEESSWFLERLILPRRKLLYLMGDIELPVENYQSDPGLKSLDSISNAGNTISGGQSGYLGSSLSPDDIIVDRLSVMPEDVHHIITQKDEETISGQIIPRGIRLSQICPKEGMTILTVNDGAITLGMYPKVHHSRELSSGVYFMRFNSGLGRGSEDTVEVQKRFNRFDRNAVKYMENSSTPAHTYVKGSVDRRHIKQIGNSAAAIPINREVVQALGTMDVVKSLQPGTIPAQLFQYTYDILNQYRQLTSHSTDFTNAFPGVDNKTATGAKLAKSNADSVFSPALQVKAEVREIGRAHV